MRILVTGASGLLGLNLCLQSYDSHEIIGVDQQWLDGLPFQLEKVDLLDGGSVDRLLDSWKPEAVIHCAALADLEACEVDPGFAARVNAELPGELATSCSALNIALVYISTDAVFDGKKDGTYTEKDRPNPLSVYAKTKLEGEYAVLSKHKNALAVRVNYFGWSLSGKRSLSEFFYNKLSTVKKCSGFTDIWFCPMFVGDLVEILWNDAAGLDSDNYKKFKIKDGLVRTTSYGKVHKYTKTAISILHEYAENETATITTIPSDWTIKIRRLK